MLVILMVSIRAKEEWCKPNHGKNSHTPDVLVDDKKCFKKNDLLCVPKHLKTIVVKNTE